MSLDNTKRRILCDNRDCGTHTALPILSNTSERPSSLGATRSPAAGWLFVEGAYEPRHYCPSCGTKILAGRPAQSLGGFAARGLEHSRVCLRLYYGGE